MFDEETQPADPNDDEIARLFPEPAAEAQGEQPPEGEQKPDPRDAKIAELEEKIGKYEPLAAFAETYIKTRGQEQPSQNQPPPTDPEAARKHIVERLNKRFFEGSPGDAIADAIALGAQLAREEMSKTIEPRGAQLANIAVENMKAAERQRNPVLYAKAEKHLNDMLANVPPSQMAKLTPEQINQGFQTAYRAALGQAYEEEVTKATTGSRQGAEPPLYGGGVSSGGTGARSRSLTPEQRVMVQQARNAGLSDADIKELLAEEGVTI